MRNFQGTVAFQLQWVIRSIVFNSILAKLQQTKQDFKTHTHTHKHKFKLFSYQLCHSNEVASCKELSLARLCNRACAIGVQDSLTESTVSNGLHMQTQVGKG